MEWTNQAEITPQSGYVTCIRFSPDNSRAALCTTTGQIEIRNPRDLSEIITKQVHTKSVNEIRWSEDSQLLLSCSDDGTLVLSNSSDLLSLRVFKGHHSYILSCDISPTNLRIVSGSYDESVRIWDTSSGKCLKFISAHSEPVSSVSFSRDTKFVISSSWDGICRLWDSFSGTCVKSFEVCRIPISFSILSPNDKFILASSNNSVIKLIRIADSKTVAIYRGHQNLQFGLFASFSIDLDNNPEVFSPSETGEIIGWNLNSQEIAWRIKLPDAGPTLCADICRRGNLLIAAGSTEKCHSVYLFYRGDLIINDQEVEEVVMNPESPAEPQSTVVEPDEEELNRDEQVSIEQDEEIQSNYESNQNEINQSESISNSTQQTEYNQNQQNEINEEINQNQQNEINEEINQNQQNELNDEQSKDVNVKDKQVNENDLNQPKSENQIESNDGTVQSESKFEHLHKFNDEKKSLIESTVEIKHEVHISGKCTKGTSSEQRSSHTSEQMGISHLLNDSEPVHRPQSNSQQSTPQKQDNDFSIQSLLQ